MQAMPLNTTAAAPKSAGNAAAKADTADAASPPQASEDVGVFGNVLARQVNSQTQTQEPRAGLAPADIAKLIEGKDGQSDLQLQIELPAVQAVDPNAMAGLIAQALAAFNTQAGGQAAQAKEASAAASSPPADGLAAALDGTRQALDGTRQARDGATMPVATAARREQAETADFAVSGKSLPSAALSERAGEAKTSLDALTESFGGQLAAAQQAPVAQAAKGDTAAVASDAIEARVGAPTWSEGLGQKVVWMVGQQRHSAEIQLNPPNLGPLEVKLTVSQDQVSASFVSHHADVRNAIEAALPRLREMLADSGITLGNVSVGAESFAQQQQQAQQQASSGRGGQSRADTAFDGVAGADGVATPEASAGMTRIESNAWGVNTFV
jgi:flagellar hook-length control protein FliK